MEYEDRTIVCVDCGAEFIHSAADQARYAERNFTNDPKRCRTCRDKRKASGGGGGGGTGGGPRRSFGGGASRGGAGGGGGGPRQRFQAVCAECGQQTEVPFKPTEGRPVYCRACYESRKGGGGSGGRGRTASFD